MVYRYRKSVRIAKGVKLNLTKAGVGMTVGGRGAHYSVHSSGRRTASVGLPGTGLSYVSSHKSSSSARQQPSNTPQPIQHAIVPKPGLFASKGEKLLRAAIISNLDIDLLEQVEAMPQLSNTALLFKALKFAGQKDKSASIKILQSLHNEGYRPEADKLVQKYARATQLTVSSAPGINLVLTLTHDDLAIFLAELYRQHDRFKEASVLLHSVPDSFNKLVFVCRLCDSAEKYELILPITNNITNNSEQSMLLLIYRGLALSKTGHIDASIATFKEVLRYPSRNLDLKMLGWRERGRMYIEAGKKSLAKKDLEKVFAENSEYPEITELLARIDI